jgi:hypothetical protein
MNGPAWRALAMKYRNDPAMLEEALLYHYMSQLAQLGVAVIATPMSFEDKKRTMYHLLFTSSNTAGLASAKKKLQQGEAYQAALKAQLKAARQSQNMFDFMAAEAEPVDPVNIDALAADIASFFHGRSPTKDQVIRYGLMKPHVLDTHVTRALTRLKNQGRVVFRAELRYRDPIRFAS